MAIYELRFVRYLPFMTAAIMSLSSLLAYVISASMGHAPALLPFISQTTAFPPESGIFTLLLFSGGLAGVGMLALHYTIVTSFNEIQNNCVMLVNWLCLLFGLAGFGGLFVVASFPLRSSLQQPGSEVESHWLKYEVHPHMLGCSVAYLGFLLYMAMGTLLARLLYRSYVWLMRGALLTFSCAAVALMTGYSSFYAHQLDPEMVEYEKVGGFPGSELGQWILGTLTVVFFVTLWQEFRYLTVSVIIITYKPSSLRTVDVSRCCSLNLLSPDKQPNEPEESAPSPMPSGAGHPPAKREASDELSYLQSSLLSSRYMPKRSSATTGGVDLEYSEMEEFT